MPLKDRMGRVCCVWMKPCLMMAEEEEESANMARLRLKMTLIPVRELR